MSSEFSVSSAADHRFIELGNIPRTPVTSFTVNSSAKWETNPTATCIPTNLNKLVISDDPEVIDRAVEAYPYSNFIAIGSQAVNLAIKNHTPLWGKVDTDCLITLADTFCRDPKDTSTVLPLPQDLVPVYLGELRTSMVYNAGNYSQQRSLPLVLHGNIFSRLPVNLDLVENSLVRGISGAAKFASDNLVASDGFSKIKNAYSKGWLAKPDLPTIVKAESGIQEAVRYTVDDTLFNEVVEGTTGDIAKVKDRLISNKKLMGVLAKYFKSQATIEEKIALSRLQRGYRKSESKLEP